MNINTNTNFSDKEDLDKVSNFFSRTIRFLFVFGVILFPWILLPNYSKSLELPREIFLMFFSGLFLVLCFFNTFKKGEFEWKRTKLNWIMGVWIISLGLLFLYSKNYKIAWEGYPGSATGGLSEYLSLILLFFLAIQLFSEEEWKKIAGYFTISVASVLVFYMIITVYFQNNNILTLNFARTPSLVAAASGVVALSLWWFLKRTESVRKGWAFLIVLVLFFISSLLDFHLSWWMWTGGVLVIVLLDLVVKTEGYLKEKETRTLGVNKERISLFSTFFQGDSKYLFLIFLFALSRSLSPIFLGTQKIILLPFFDYLVQYPLFGRRVFFYLVINLIIFIFGFYYFWKLKKERSAIVVVLSGLASISIGHLLYFSESTILFFLNWILIVYAGLTFLRKAPEKDYLYFLKSKSKGKRVFVVVGSIFSVIITGLVLLRITSLFG